MDKLLIFIFLIHFSVFSQEKWNTLKIEEIAQNHFVFTTYQEIDNVPFPSNGMFVIGQDIVLIIDSPWNESQFQNLLDSIQVRAPKKQIMSISTHFHDDRTMALDFFKSKGVKTYSSAKTKELCQLRNEKQAAYTFSNDTVFSFLGLKFETFYPGKGHTEDNILVYFPESKILFGGCFVKSIENKSLGFIGDADIKEWKKSVKKVIRKYKDANIVVPGHFKWSDTQALTHTLNIIQKR